MEYPVRYGASILGERKKASQRNHDVVVVVFLKVEFNYKANP